MKYLVLFGFFTLSFLQYATVQAQDLSSIETVRVDELSDAQIKKFIQKMEESGYTQSQLETLAKARGMSALELNKLKQRIAKLQSSSKSDSTTVSSRMRVRQELPRDKNLDSKDKDSEQLVEDPFAQFIKEDTTKTELPIFGQSFFSNENLTFEPSVNIPTPENYILGAGDEIIIDIWGASENTYQLTVSPDGAILIPNIGPVFLQGLNISKAEEKLKGKLRSIYSNLGRNTFAQISLGQIRSISVNVIGEVEMPGTYTLSSFATAFNALYSAGGPNENGSLRNILIFRGGQKVGTLDAYKFLIDGEGENISLQDQDVVLVKPYTSRVSVDGLVKRPAVYEILPEEPISKVLEFAGGFAQGAYSESISLKRNESNYKTIKTVVKAEYDNLLLQNGDFIDIGEISKQYKNRVRIEGAVNHAGEFELRSDMKLSDLIDLADGFRGDYFPAQALIIRENKDLTFSNIAFNPLDVLNGDFDMPLKSEDFVKIQSIFDLREELTLSIEGEVQFNGEFPYVEGMTVENLIYMAGGFKEAAAKSFVEVARRINDNSKEVSHTSEIFNFPISSNLTVASEASQFILKPYDLVVVRESPFYHVQEVVSIEGEIQYPGKYTLKTNNDRVSDVLRRAGGFTKEAFVKGGTLIRETEYFDEDAAATVKKLRLEVLESRDSTALEGTFTVNKTEAIAIELERIIANPGSDIDLILKKGDVISIPKKMQTVRVRGEVYFSGTLVHDSNKSFPYYLSRAGGTTTKAKKNKAYVVYSNGSARRTNSFLWFRHYPEVEPGSEIIVPAKPERRRLSPQEVIGITTGVATLGLLTNQIVNTLK